MFLATYRYCQKHSVDSPMWIRAESSFSLDGIIVFTDNGSKMAPTNLMVNSGVVRQQPY